MQSNFTTTRTNNNNNNKPCKITKLSTVKITALVRLLLNFI